MAIWMTFRSLLRSRWLVWLGLALFIGVSAGAVMAGVAGARRTASAHDRFLEQQRAMDVVILLECGAQPATTCVRKFEDLPSVAAATIVDLPGAFIATADGRSVQPQEDPCWSGPGRVDVIGDRSGRFGVDLNVSRIVAGRRANPAEVDEVVLSKSVADRLALAPGSTLNVALFDGADCLDDPGSWSPRVSLRVVGIGLAPGEVQPPSGEYLSTVTVTPAFLAAHLPDRGPGGEPLAIPVRLRGGADVESLLSDVASIGGRATSVIDFGDRTEAVERGIRPQAVTLALVAGLGALAGAAVLGQALVRQGRADAADRPTLSALGMNRHGQVAVSILAASFLGVIAGATGALVAVAASPLTPAGVAGEIEPDPGVSVDAVVIGLGALSTVVFVMAAVGLQAGRATNVGHGHTAARRRVAVADGMAHAGFPTTMVAGVRMALERGSGRGSVPVGSSVAAIAIAVLAVAGSLTFGAGITHLRETPRLIGTNWDLLLGWPAADGEPMAQERVEAALADHPDVTAFVAGTFFSPFPEGRPLQLGPERRDVFMLSFGAGGDIGPSLLAGRVPTAPDEILLGRETLDDLGLAVGDTVDAYGQAGSWEDPGEETSVRLGVVGMGVIPNAGGDGRLGRGASVTLGAVKRLNPTAEADGFWLRLADGSDAGAVVATLLDEVGAAHQDDAFFPQAMFTDVLAVRDLEQVDRAPQLFAAVMGVMAVGVIAHVLVSALHANRRDLAMLRALGLRRRDVARVVAWQSVVYVLVASAVGVPLGVVVGRVAWRSYAQRLGAVPEPVVPWAALGAASAVALVIAVVAARALSRRATARGPATVLRSE